MLVTQGSTDENSANKRQEEITDTPAAVSNKVSGALADILDNCINGTAEQIKQERIFIVSKKLLVLLAQYVPWDGTVVEGPMDAVYSRIREELELLHRELGIDLWSKPLNWFANHEYMLNSWLFMYLKIHHILSQCIRCKPSRPTLMRTNGYETISLASAIYHVDLDQPGLDYGNSSESTSSSTKASNEGTKKAISDEELLDKSVEEEVAKLWPGTEIYLYIAPDLWSQDEPVTQPLVREMNTENAMGSNNEENRIGENGGRKSVILIPLDEGHVSMAVTSYGRFDAYLLASIAECLLPVIERNPDTLMLPNLLLQDKQMVLSRASHGRRVYEDATSTFVVTPAKFDWYNTLLTSGSLKAVQDTFVDFASEIWHTQFNRFDEDNVARLETLMIALLGHKHDMVRSQSSVCMNNIVDRHDWQQEIPFLPTIKTTEDQFTIEVNLDRPDHKAPEDVFVIVSAPSRTRTAEVYTYHSLEWVAEGEGRHWRGVCQFGHFPRAGFYDWRLVRADRTSGSWRAVHATIESLRRTCTGSFSLAQLSDTSSSDVEFNSRNLWPELGRLKEVQEATGHSAFRTLPLQGRFIVQPGAVRSLCLHEINVDSFGAKYDDTHDRFAERGTFTKVKEKLTHFKTNGVTGLCLAGCQARNNGKVSYSRSAGDSQYENPDASPYAVTCRASVCEVVGGRGRLDDLVREANRQDVKIIVDFQSRVAAAGAHRKYNFRGLRCVDSNGRCRSLLKGHGKYFAAEESCELDYRERENWELYIEDICEWVSTHRVDGLKLDCAHLLPRIYPVNENELNRLDPDNLNHYSAFERLRGKVVLPVHKDAGFWSSTAAAGHWPNPFITKVAREIWRRNPDCILIADCGLLPDGEEKKLGVLARSGMVPLMQSLPNILLKIFGKEINDK
ncbi:hypothetical protein GNI_074440 [Gregarina niphandrodes]|uniref:Uncharacterized protein n=1 Tax=Gregarina niphandrodes TaxID=110365 RepID=A0A023B706_GRENI|nr:hypothetical protein GNI_074440 [Gregarina niphandrodes]EZG66884.1 hypothetical protein GNI_074440 [Gregarina niphandrodes]|eukprot:XP_011130442.1 hypothetical protein GNI_074440 [Gregarina niphandrodes]